jgi:hypothetical protein
MPFEWMKTDEHGSDDGSRRVEACAREVRERAALLQRLGYDKATVVHRCMGNLVWAFSSQGTPPLTPAAVRKLVGEVYSRAK